jgi:penicillin-binding protein 2
MSPNFLKKFRKNRYIEAQQRQNADPFSVKEGRFSFGQLKDSFYYTDWTEGSFLADTSRKEIVSRSFDFGQLKYFTLVAALALILLLGRAFWLQVTKNNYYSSLSENNRLRAEVVEAKRGIIYSRNMQPLVRNKANFVLYFKPIDLPRDELTRDELLRQISQILAGGATSSPAVSSVNSVLTTKAISVTADNPVFYQLKDAVSKVQIGSLESYQPLFVADNIDYDKAMLIALKLPDWPGVFLSNKIRREYLLPSATSSPSVLGVSSFSHLLGYTGKVTDTDLQNLGTDYSSVDYVGKTGLEASWETELRGVPGHKNIEVDALGRQKQVVSEVPAVDGDNLELSLDAGLQEKVEEVTQQYIDKAKLHQAAVIMMNPNTGEILAMVSLPAYNNNLFAGGISQADYSKFLDDPSQPLFNRAVSGEFPSGSTIKPIFAAGALQSGIITAATTVMSTGGIHLGQWFFPDWKVGGHGLTDVKKALALSVNTFFYYIGGGYKDFKGLGVDGLAKYARLFGLGQITGIDLPGERPGFVPTAAWKLATKKEAWYVGDTYHFAIGQGDVLVTPLQVANYTAAIANGGTLYQPHLVSKVMDSNNNVIQEIQPKILASNLVDSADLEIVREGMRQTITAGSARSLNTLPVQVAGKTGTAQWSTTKQPHAWFIGFAPYDKPKVVIAVLVQEGIGGDVIAAPIAKDILNWYFTSDPNYQSN